MFEHGVEYNQQPDRIHVAFDDHRLVANAGLLLIGNCPALGKTLPIVSVYRVDVFGKP